MTTTIHPPTTSEPKLTALGRGTQRASTQHAAARATPPHRDATIDAVRAACLCAVVVLHALMVGVEVSHDGTLTTSVALSGNPWFAPITWVFQVMPLFFIAGGFAALSQWRRMQGRGTRASEYVMGRVRRLALPAGLMILVVGGVLSAAGAFGMSPELVAEAGMRIGQPLWFLAVYLGVTALVPTMVWLHDRHPGLTLGGLVAGVILIDVLASLSVTQVGYLNLLFVWLLMQQLGFVLLDGNRRGVGATGGIGADGTRTAARHSVQSRRRLVIGVVAPLLVLAILVMNGASPDMIENLNPPTTAIALLGTSQLFMLQLIRPHLDRAMRGKTATRISARAGAHAMTIYLWHMPVILLLVAGVWAVGLPLPAPHTGEWWATRVPWLLAVAVSVILAVTVLARLEQWITRWVTQHRGRVTAGGAVRATGAAGVTGAAALSVLLAVAGVVTALLTGLASPASFLPAAGLLVSAILLPQVVTVPQVVMVPQVVTVPQVQGRNSPETSRKRSNSSGVSSTPLTAVSPAAHPARK
ncbi:MAG: acyltransferase family protein [Leucobacter sp.]